MKSVTAGTWGPVAIFAAVTLCISALYQRFEVPHPDASAYAELGSNLLAGRGYQFDFQPHTMYPPGLPLIYAAVGLAFGVGYPVRMFIAGAFAFLGLTMAYLVLRRRVGNGVALGISLLLASGSTFFFAVTALPMSDIPYFGLGFTCLFLVDRLWSDSPPLWSRILLTATLTVCLSLLVLTRTVGVAFPPAILFFVAIQWLRGKSIGKERLLSLLVPAAAGLMALVIWTHWATAHRVPPLEGEYRDQYIDQLRMKDFHNTQAGTITASDLVARTVAGCAYAGAIFAQMSLDLSRVEPAFWSPLVALSILLILLGFWESLRSGGDAADWYVLLSLPILVSWVYFRDDGARFLLPLFPLLALQAYRGGARLLLMLREEPKRVAFVAAALGVVQLSVTAAMLWAHAISPSKQYLASAGVWFLAILAAGLVVGFPARLKAALHGNTRTWRLAFVSLFAVLIAFSFVAQIRSTAKLMHRDARSLPQYPVIVSGQWIASNTPQDSVIMADDYFALHRLSGRKVVRVPATTEPRLVETILRERRVAFLVVEENGSGGEFHPDSRDLRAVLSKEMEPALEVATQGRGYTIYRLHLDTQVFAAQAGEARHRQSTTE